MASQGLQKTGAVGPRSGDLEAAAEPWSPVAPSVQTTAPTLSPGSINHDGTFHPYSYAVPQHLSPVRNNRKNIEKSERGPSRMSSTASKANTVGGHKHRPTFRFLHRGPTTGSICSSRPQDEQGSQKVEMPKPEAMEDDGDEDEESQEAGLCLKILMAIWKSILPTYAPLLWFGVHVIGAITVAIFSLGSAPGPTTFAVASGTWTILICLAGNLLFYLTCMVVRLVAVVGLLGFVWYEKQFASAITSTVDPEIFYVIFGLFQYIFWRNQRVEQPDNMAYIRLLGPDYCFDKTGQFVLLLATSCALVFSIRSLVLAILVFVFQLNFLMNCNEELVRYLRKYALLRKLNAGWVRLVPFVSPCPSSNNLGLFEDHTEGAATTDLQNTDSVAPGEILPSETAGSSFNKNEPLRQGEISLGNVTGLANDSKGDFIISPVLDEKPRPHSSANTLNRRKSIGSRTGTMQSRINRGFAGFAKQYSRVFDSLGVDDRKQDGGAAGLENGPAHYAAERVSNMEVKYSGKKLPDVLLDRNIEKTKTRPINNWLAVQFASSTHPVIFVHGRRFELSNKSLARVTAKLLFAELLDRHNTLFRPRILGEASQKLALMSLEGHPKPPAVDVGPPELPGKRGRTASEMDKIASGVGAPPFYIPPLGIEKALVSTGLENTAVGLRRQTDSWHLEAITEKTEAGGDTVRNAEKTTSMRKSSVGSIEEEKEEKTDPVGYVELGGSLDDKIAAAGLSRTYITGTPFNISIHPAKTDVRNFLENENSEDDESPSQPSQPPVAADSGPEANMVVAPTGPSQTADEPARLKNLFSENANHAAENPQESTWSYQKARGSTGELSSASSLINDNPLDIENEKLIPAMLMEEPATLSPMPSARNGTGVSTVPKEGEGQAGASPNLLATVEADSSATYITPELLHLFMKKEEADLFLKMVDLAGHGRINEDMFVRVVIYVYSLRKRLIKHLTNQRSITVTVKRLMSAFLWFVSAIALMTIFGLDFKTLIISGAALLSALTVSLSFIYTNFINSVIFIGFHNPFNVGDRIRVNYGPILTVKGVTTYTTILETLHAQPLIWANYELIKLNIINESRAKNSTFELVYWVDTRTRQHTLREFKESVGKYLLKRPCDFVKDSFNFFAYTIKPGQYYEVAFWITTVEGWGNWKKVWTLKTELFEYILCELERLRITFRMPVMPLQHYNAMGGPYPPRQANVLRLPGEDGRATAPESSDKTLEVPITERQAGTAAGDSSLLFQSFAVHRSSLFGSSEGSNELSHRKPSAGMSGASHRDGNSQHIPGMGEKFGSVYD